MDKGALNVSVCKNSGFNSQKRRGLLYVCAVKCKITAWHRNFLVWAVTRYSILGVKFDLILWVLRSQFFDFLRQTLCRHALGTWKRLVQKKKGHFFSSYSSRLNAHQLTSMTSSKVCDWSGHTFSVLAPVLDPSQKKWLCHPLPPSMAVSMIPNMWHSSC